jgi:hypothetical protein
MKGQNTFLETPATPEQILGIFQNWQRLEAGNALKEKELLSFETSVRDWRDIGDLLGWQQLSVALNKFFGITFSKDEWRATMKPEKQKTLRDICTLIATRAILPTVGELNVFGKPCRTAAAFFALLFCLRKVGLDIGKIRPSSRLDSYLRLHTQTLVEVVSKFAPGKIPVMKTKINLGHRISGWVCLSGLLALIGGGVFGKPDLILAACLILVFGFIAITVFSNLPPAKFQFEGCETFGDLSRLIAANCVRNK